MTLPPYFKTTNHKVSCLQKSLYGLKQAPRQCFAKLSSKLLECGFVRSYADYSLFTSKKVMNPWLFLFMSMNNSCFHIKDLGSLKYSLGNRNCQK